MERINIAHLPTPIQPLPRLSEEYGTSLFIKRDDYTGVELSGNKVRKLEFTVGKALQESADTLITTGAIQSNHCRATAAVAARMGLGCVLILKAERPEKAEGNYFFEQLLGAEIVFIGPDEDGQAAMEEAAAKKRAEGKRPYLIPLGASDATGSRGYEAALHEIRAQEEQLGVHFDAIVSATGSAGTYAGLWYANRFSDAPADMFGISVAFELEKVKEAVWNIAGQMAKEDGRSLTAEDKASIRVTGQYLGDGYAISRPEEIACIEHVARTEGVILDPVYTGKAFYGMLEEIRRGSLAKAENILFIHTGGLMGWKEAQRDLVGF